MPPPENGSFTAPPRCAPRSRGWRAGGAPKGLTYLGRRLPCGPLLRPRGSGEPRRGRGRTSAPARPRPPLSLSRSSSPPARRPRARGAQSCDPRAPLRRRRGPGRHVSVVSGAVGPGTRAAGAGRDAAGRGGRGRASVSRAQLGWRGDGWRCPAVRDAWAGRSATRRPGWTCALSLPPPSLCSLLLRPQGTQISFLDSRSWGPQGLAGSWVPSPIPRASCVLGDPCPPPSTPEWLSFLSRSWGLRPAHRFPSLLLALGAFSPPQMEWKQPGVKGHSLMALFGVTPSVQPNKPGQSTPLSSWEDGVWVTPLPQHLR